MIQCSDSLNELKQVRSCLADLIAMFDDGVPEYEWDGIKARARGARTTLDCIIANQVDQPPIYLTLKSWVDRAQFKDTNSRYGVNVRPEGYEYVEIPLWELRQAIDTIDTAQPSPDRDGLIAKLEAIAYNPTMDDRMGQFIPFKAGIAIVRQHQAETLQAGDSNFTSLGGASSSNAEALGCQRIATPSATDQPDEAPLDEAAIIAELEKNYMYLSNPLTGNERALVSHIVKLCRRAPVRESGNDAEAWRNRCHAADKEYQELMEKYLALKGVSDANS